MRKRIDFICPTCKHKKRVTINDEYNETHIDKLIDKSIFRFKCDKCDTDILLDYNFVLRTKKYSISYGDAKNVDRICKSIDDFKEKVLIFEDGLNDIFIELAKKKIEYELKKDLNLRYDGSDDARLIFYSLDDENSYSFNRELYDYYLKKYKTPNVKDVEINYLNYFKYIK